ncbi:hypothetical protein [Paenibacillus qinlingensis]|nr:hypothetical protein [Paenibacillus qinlingensis]
MSEETIHMEQAIEQDPGYCSQEKVSARAIIPIKPRAVCSTD